MDGETPETFAARQFGLISHGQALALGVTFDGMRHRVRRGRWERRHRGVYRVVGVPASSRQAALAAVLAVGANAAVSHESSAALRDLSGFEIEPITVSV